MTENLPMDLRTALNELGSYAVANAHQWALVAGTVWVGLKAAAIARAQSETQAKLAEIEIDRLRFDLWQRRYALYTQIWSYVSEAVQTGAGVSNAASRELTNVRPEIRFLFGDDILAYVDEIHGRVLDDHLYSVEYRSNPAAANSSGSVQRHAENMHWFSAQLAELPKRFDSFMRFDQARLNPQRSL